MSGMRKLADAIFGPSAGKVIEAARFKKRQTLGPQADRAKLARLRYEIAEHAAIIGAQCVGRYDLDDPTLIEVKTRARALLAAISSYWLARHPDNWLARHPDIQKEHEKVEDAHPGWLALVGTADFYEWMAVQPARIQRYAASEKAEDAIRVLDLYKSHGKKRIW